VEYTNTVFSYLTFCADSVKKQTRIFLNQKPWMTSEVKLLIRDSNRAQYFIARTNLRRSNEAVKEKYERKIESHLTNNNPRQMWLGIQHITDLRGNNISPVSINTSLVEELNRFAHFQESRPLTYSTISLTK